MSGSRQRDVRFLSVRMGRSEALPAHRHNVHQLMRVDAGALAFTHRASSWVVPTGGVVWLPAGLEHRLDALDHTIVATLYVRPKSRDRFVTAGPVEMSPLLSAVMTALSRRIEDPARRRHLEQVVRDELAALRLRTFVVALPVDSAAREVARAVITDPADRRTLPVLAAAVGASPRTMQRRFRAETGLSFQTWRRRAGLQQAMTALDRGDNISEVAHQCGFSSASSFIAAFRAELGTTPAAWRRAPDRRDRPRVLEDGTG